MDAYGTEIFDKVQKLVKEKFLGDYMAAFKHYDLDSSGKLGPKDLWCLLADAGVGNVLTRKLWVSGLVSKLDKDADGAVSIPELAAAVAEAMLFK